MLRLPANRCDVVGWRELEGLSGPPLPNSKPKFTSLVSAGHLVPFGSQTGRCGGLPQGTVGLLEAESFFGKSRFILQADSGHRRSPCAEDSHCDGVFIPFWDLGDCTLCLGTEFQGGVNAFYSRH